MKDDCFHPFNAASHDTDSDFNFDDVGNALELSAVQKRLLNLYLRDICLKIWFTSDDGEKEPRFELCCFWDEFVCTVASVRLDFFLDYTFAQRNELGDEAEISALQNLRDKIDEAIALRKREPVGNDD